MLTIIDLLFKFYFFLYPFYLLPSGRMQLADLLLIFVIFPLSFIKRGSFPFWEKVKLKGLFLLVIYSFIVESVLSLFTSEVSNYKTVLYFIYMLLFIYSLDTWKKSIDFKDIILKTSFFSIFLQLVIAISLKEVQYRAMGSFNNPNQLAYYTLLLNVIFFFVSETVNVAFHIKFLFIIMSIFLMIMSLSNSGIISLFIFYIIYYVKTFKQNKIKLGNIMYFSLLLIIGRYSYQNRFYLMQFDIIRKVFQRLGATTDKVLKAGNVRGYSRLVEYPEYLLFGAGTGALYRFNSRIEIHSSYAYILFNYGIIGFLFYILDLFKIIRRNVYSLVFLLPILIYSFGHNGLRSPLYWMLIYLLVDYEENENESTEKTENFN